MPRRRHHKGGHTKAQVTSPETENKSTYLIKTSDVMGRYLVANHDLPEGTVIIEEEPLVVGPAQDSLPNCLACCSSITAIETAYRCGKCQWPLCSKNCKGLYKRLGHSKEECDQLSTRNLDSPQLLQNQLYNAIVPLRCLLLKEHHPDKWNTLMTMEAHNEIRKKISAIWDYNQKSVVDRIIKEWKLIQYTEDEIHKVCGILEVNAFSVGEESKNIRGLYPTSFLIAHACVPNTSHTDDDGFNMKIFTSIPIAKDGIITLSYTNSLEGTRKRRQNLKESKFFECDCSRCKDPTELGTYLSAIKCSECGSGYLLPSNPLAEDTVWICNNKTCKKSVPANNVEVVINRLEKELKAVDYNSLEALETSIRYYSGILHKNHYHIIGMKYALSQLYGKSAGYLIHEMNETMLERKKQICEDILEIFNVVEPGLTRIRGVTMYELHAPIMVLTIQRFQMHKISKTDLCRKLRKVAMYLKECCRILKFETRSSQEGCIRTAADDALSQLKSWESVVGKL